ncbi:MAG TPA: ATP-binding protein [Kofleriaceae bacterium]|nr:ATP-binding protein [Kofleriaceae bacterium]
MGDVSCRALGMVLKLARQQKLADAQLLAGVNYDIDFLRNTKNRIEWDAFCRILTNARALWSLEEFSDQSELFIQSPFVAYVGVVARLLFSPRDLFDWVCKRSVGHGAQMFANCVTPSYEHIGSDVTVIRLEIQKPYAVSPEFFWMTRGTFIAMPTMVGAGYAQVDMTIDERIGTFRIHYKRRRGTLASLIRILTWPFTARAAARELKDAHETLIERYREIEDARAKLDRQATQLRIAHAVNDLVQRDLDLARTLDTVAKALVDEAGFVWAEITLRATDPTNPASARIARFGTAAHDVLLERALEARGGETIGDLRVAPNPGASREEREELLAFIVPTLAVALQNALSYQALTDYRSGLERLVDQRTAELRHARDQLAGTVVELREAQGARERFFGNITHEIRTPLSLILLATADIQSRAGAALDDRARQNLEAITSAADKLLRLVDELLLLAASQEDKLHIAPERTDLDALQSAVITTWRPAAEAADLTLIARATPSLCAKVDPIAIERVISNLLSNAIKYTPRGGTVEIELADEPDGLRISVLDTGVGIGEDLHDRLFGRFERAYGEPHRKIGTGLGLFVAKQLVEAHGGTITALQRKAGTGSELRVVLPAALVIRDAVDRVPVVAKLRLAESPVEPAVPVMRLLPSGFSAGTILLAEDDVQLAEMIARALADEYTMIVAHDGATALELVPHHQPQLLITDVDMPGIDGIELSRRFREITGDRLAPIIVLSAMSDRGTRVAGLDAGAVDYVIKPFDPQELHARIRAQFRMRDLAVRLQRAEQLSTMGILTAGLAHELRNPANGIVNAVGPLAALLPRDLVRPETAVGQLIEVLATYAEQIGFLARQLLGFRKGVVELDLRQTPVRDLVHRAMSLVNPGGVEIRVEIACDGVVKCAPPLLIQVLTNLMENAIYAAGPGGWAQLRSSAKGGNFTVEVSDSGPGVPPQLRERVFEPFFTTKPAGVGTGLGLSLARDIIHRHGGVLEIRDRGEQTCFVVELPTYSALDTADKPAMLATPQPR